MSTVLGLQRLRLHHSATTVTPPSVDGRTEATSSGHQSDSPGAAVDVFSTSFPVEVLPYLYLGNARSSADLDTLYRNGIAYILNVTPDVPNSFSGCHQFRYMQIPVNDHWSQNMAAYFPSAIAFIGSYLFVAASIFFLLQNLFVYSFLSLNYNTVYTSAASINAGGNYVSGCVAVRACLCVCASAFTRYTFSMIRPPLR